jgi:aminopeptidase
MSFDSFIQQDAPLVHAADVAVTEVVRVKPGERVLIITNPEPDVSAISMALYDAVRRAGGRPVVVYQDRKTQLDFAEDSVIGALEAGPDAVFSISAEKMGKDEKGIRDPYGERIKYDHIFHHHLYGEKTVRGFWSPTVTRDMFVRTVPIDYARLARESALVKRVLDRAVSVRVVNGNGTDLTIGLAGREAKVDDGDFSRPGTGGNLPAGETFISPVVGTSEGTIAFDGSISSHEGVIVISEPIRVKVEAGFVTEVKGGAEAETLARSLQLAAENARRFEREGKLAAGKGELYAKNAYNIGELGIGLNPQARITGNMLEDEKAAKTCHIAIGHNYDDDAPALIHLDGLITGPTITAVMEDGSRVTVLENGELALG